MVFTTGAQLMAHRREHHPHPNQQNQSHSRNALHHQSPATSKPARNQSTSSSIAKEKPPELTREELEFRP